MLFLPGIPPTRHWQLAKESSSVALSECTCRERPSKKNKTNKKKLKNHKIKTTKNTTNTLLFLLHPPDFFLLKSQCCSSKATWANPSDCMSANARHYPVYLKDCWKWAVYLPGCSHGSLEMELAKLSWVMGKASWQFNTTSLRPTASCRRHLIKHSEKNYKADTLKFALGSLPKLTTMK